MNTDILCVLCRRPMKNTHRSACESCVPPDESEIVATSKLAASRREVEALQRACEEHIAERNRLGDALQKIALLGDTGSESHWNEFNTGPGQPIVNGWRVAERMREIALNAVGLGECETCQDEGQVQLTDEGGNRSWWPCPVCRPPAI